MDLKQRLEMCLENYKRYKNEALSNTDKVLIMRAMEKAFFWIELQLAYMTLWTAENSVQENGKTNLIRARLNICKRLNEYSRKILREWKDQELIS